MRALPDWGRKRRARLRDLPELGRPARAPRRILRRPAAVRMALPRTLRYLTIREQVMRTVQNLSARDLQRMRLGTLPEIIAQLALLRLGYQFVAQRPMDGGRLRLGGAVIDVLVLLGPRPVVLRVQGDYWHSLPMRRRKDAMQLARLQARGYRVADVWEGDLYRAWAEGNYVEFVDNAIRSAL